MKNLVLILILSALILAAGFSLGLWQGIFAAAAIVSVLFTSWARARQERQYKFFRASVIERYGDFTEIGEWGVATQNEDGEWETEVRGKMLEETVKYRANDGSIKLGAAWVIDNDRRVTGFDPPKSF